MFNINESRRLSETFIQPFRVICPELTLQSLQIQMDDCQIELSYSGQELSDIFEKNPLLSGAILSQENKFFGMISRHEFLERISTQYGRDTFLRRNLECLYSFVNQEILILPANTLISEAVQQCIQRPPQRLYEPLVVKFHDESYRLLDTQKLLIAQSQIYKLSMEIVAERNIALDRANLAITKKNRQMFSYLQQVEKVTAAAAALENDTYEPELLSEVATRIDELGQLARTFQQMVQTVKTRKQEAEAQLKRQLQELQIEIDQQKRNKEVAEITQSDHFQELQAEAELLQFDDNW